MPVTEFILAIEFTKHFKNFTGEIYIYIYIYIILCIYIYIYFCEYLHEDLHFGVKRFTVHLHMCFLNEES